MIYVMLATGFEEIEALTVLDVLRRADIEVNSVSCEEAKLVTGAHHISVQADRMLSECSLETSEMIVLPGGMPGTLNLLNNSLVTDLLQKANEQSVKIAAICAAPMILGKLGLLNGKTAVCYPGFEADLQGAKASDARVVTDGNFTTSKGPGTALEFSLRLVEELKDKKIAEKLKGDMLAK